MKKDIISQIHAQVEKLIFIISQEMKPKRISDFFFYEKMPSKHFLSSNSDFILSFFLGLIQVLNNSCEDFRTMLGNQHGIFPL